MRSASALRRLWRDLGLVGTALARHRGRGEPGAFSMPAFLTQTRALFVDGGITVETPPAAAPGAPVIARSLIQPDGDVLHLLSPAILASPEHWQAHRQALDACYARLGAMLALGRLGFRALVLLSAAGAASTAVQTNWPPAPLTAVGIAALLLAPHVLRRGLGVALRLWIDRAQTPPGSTPPGPGKG